MFSVVGNDIPDNAVLEIVENPKSIFDMDVCVVRTRLKDKKYNEGKFYYCFFLFHCV